MNEITDIMELDRSKEDIPIQFGAVLMLDALGVSKYDNEKCKYLIKFLEDVKSEYERLKFEEIQMYQSGDISDSSLKDSNILEFGDTIIIYWTFNQEDTQKYLDLIRYVSVRATVFMSFGLHNGILFRGSISIGEFIVKGNIILGSAVFDAAEWYNKADWFGVMFTPKCQTFIESVMETQKKSKDESVQRSLNLINKFYITPYIVPLKARKWWDVLDTKKAFLTVMWPKNYILLYDVLWSDFGASPREAFLNCLKRIPQSDEGMKKISNGKRYFESCEKILPTLERIDRKNDTATY